MAKPGTKRNKRKSNMQAAPDLNPEDYSGPITNEPIPTRTSKNDTNTVVLTQYRYLPTGHISTRSDTRIVEGLEASSAIDSRLNSSNTDYNDIQDNNDPISAEEDVNMHHTGQQAQVVEVMRKKRRSDEPLKEWTEERELFLSEFLRLEGRDETRPELCTECGDHVGQYRCMDCDGLELVCRACILAGHKKNGLHNIEEWDSVLRFFKKISLKSLGHVYQLGHTISESCPCPIRPYAGAFTVVDLNGIHDVTLLFCGCETKEFLFLQLLRFGWFPATVKAPRTAITLRMLKFFQILSFESKSTAFEFESTLSRMTDNTGTRHVKRCYTALLRVAREYSHIKMLKRAGRGHHVSGAAGTRPGECAVLCPACPHSGRNLLPGWKDVPKEKRYLYTLYLGLDANFRLKRRAVSSNAADPSLSHGWSYFVEENKFKDFLNEFGTLIIQEPSRCSNHNAVNRERATEGFSATGVGTCDCIRHDMKRPCSVGDIQKGERYVNMDYLFFSTLKNTECVETVVSYDIACQWSIHLWDRMKQYPTSMRVDHKNKRTFRFLIPKFHLPAHIKACQTRYSFNFNKEVGRTDGEGVERGWSYINPIASSTREMGPGSRRDTLDDHFGDWNWKKTTKLAQNLLTRFEEAVPNAFEHSILHSEFTKGLNSPEIVEIWSRQLSEWEEDHSFPNPFEVTFKTLSQEQIRRQLAEKEAAEAVSGRAWVMHAEISASQLVTMGLELEIEQRRLAADRNAQTAHVTDNQRAKWTLRSTTLRHKISHWIDVQHMYIPSLAVYRQNMVDSLPEDHEETPTYEIPLILPSAIPARVSCDARLFEIEFHLRLAQCNDSLDDLRDALCLRSYVLIDKRRFQTGVSANTKSQGIVNRAQRKVNMAAEKYRMGRAALARLSQKLQKTGWEQLLPELRPQDVRALSDEEAVRERELRKKKAGRGIDSGADPTSAVSEGHRNVSWIWRQMGGLNEAEMDTEQRLHESLRIEWCKSKARYSRWAEEVELLQEERRRVLAFLDHRALTWKQLEADSSKDLPWMLPGVKHDPVSIAGREAFARQQAHQFNSMRAYFEKVWENVDNYILFNGQNVSINPASVEIEGAEEDDL